MLSRCSEVLGPAVVVAFQMGAKMYGMMFVMVSWREVRGG